MGDILSNDGKLKKKKSLLVGVFSAIPPEWKLLLKNGDDVNRTDKTVSDDDVKDTSSMSFKPIYSALVKRVQIPPTAQSKFCSLIYNISNILDWKNIYQLPGRVTLDTRTRAFQYKILNRILYTNSILYKMKLIPSPLCTFCGDHEETLEHLLVKCVYIYERILVCHHFLAK